MAINSTQSTAQILASQAASNRVAAEQAQLAAPTTQLNNNSASPFGLISEGLGTATNALNASGIRQNQQSNLDRANAIRLEQQGYTRQQAEQADAARANQHNITNQRLQKTADANITNQQFNQGIASTNAKNAAEDRRAAIAGEQALAKLPAIEADIGQREFKAFQAKGLDPTAGNFTNLEELSRFDATKGERGDNFDAAAQFFQTLPELKDDASAYSAFTDDVRDGLKQAKDKIGKNWSKAYEQLAIQRALRGTQVGAGFFSMDGNFDEEGFRDRLQTEMADIINAQGDLKNYNAIKRPFDRERNKASADAIKQGQRNF